jgi:hypothetical protein
MKKISQVERTVQLFMAGVTLTTKKLERLIKCRSATYVLKKAIELMEKMGIRVNKYRRKVRGGVAVKFYKMEMV